MARPVPTRVGRNGKTKPVGAAGKTPNKTQYAKKATGQVAGAGKYKGRTLNLTNKQLAKSGVKNAKKLSSVSISATKYNAKTKTVTGANGKPLNGKVDMGGGNIATYVNGKRVRATTSRVAAARPASKTVSRPTASRPTSSRSTSRTSSSSNNNRPSKVPSNLGNNAGSTPAKKTVGKRPASSRKASGTYTTSYKQGRAASGTYTASYNKPKRNDAPISNWIEDTVAPAISKGVSDFLSIGSKPKKKK